MDNVRIALGIYIGHNSEIMPVLMVSWQVFKAG